jgi:hypothetical protein
MGKAITSWRHAPTARHWLESLKKKIEEVHEVKGTNVFLSRNPDPYIPEKPIGDNEGIRCMILFISIC